VHPREVFKGALIANSYAIIVAHNHPGGSLTPSKEDLETTEILIKAGDLMGVKVIDHFIVSSNGLTSLRETCSYLWTKKNRLREGRTESKLFLPSLKHVNLPLIYE